MRVALNSRPATGGAIDWSQFQHGGDLPVLLSVIRNFRECVTSL
jgi:hypothetical protein